MPVYLLSCDVTKAEDRYRGLVSLIDSKFNSQRLGRYSWAIETEASADDLCDVISPRLAASDHIFIVRASRDLAWSGYPPQTATWLRRHVLKNDRVEK